MSVLSVPFFALPFLADFLVVVFGGVLGYGDAGNADGQRQGQHDVDELLHLGEISFFLGRMANSMCGTLMFASGHEQGLKHPLKSFHSIGFNGISAVKLPLFVLGLAKTPG